jgi:dihydroorotate dehydrogenase (NAD+) catalytic subunit
MYDLLGKKVRGRFAFPSGVIATNPDTARWMIQHIPQIGFYVGKSTTIEPKLGNPEDIFVLTGSDSAQNAVGYTNPGLRETIEGFCGLKESCPDDVFLMPQIGESDEEKFMYCAGEFDRIPIDGIEINVSCPHAKQGGILIGSDQKTVHSIVSAVRKATKKPLAVKLNAGVENLEEIAKAAVSAGADAISAINTLGGPCPELHNKYGGLSGHAIFPVTLDAIERLRKAVDVQIIAMGGITGTRDIKMLEKIDPGLFFEIGTALAQLSSEDIVRYFRQIEIDLKNNTEAAENMFPNPYMNQYRPFVVKEVEKLSETLIKIKFYQNLPSQAGQYVSLKIGYNVEHQLANGETLVERKEIAKPFSVADDDDGLELVIRNVGEATSRIFGLRKNDVVRIKGPLGSSFAAWSRQTVVFVGAGCGIAPVHHAAKHHNGKNIFIVGAKTRNELVYLDKMNEMGEVHVATDDGSMNFMGTVPELLERYLQEAKPEGDLVFFNCGPEIAMAKADAVERQYAKPDRIYHLVERVCSCNEGICGKCSTPEGLRVCMDGPVFSADQFTPGKYTRDKYGRKKHF